MTQFETLCREYDANPTFGNFLALPKQERMRRLAQTHMNPDDWTAEDEERDTERRGHIQMNAE